MTLAINQIYSTIQQNAETRFSTNNVFLFVSILLIDIV